MRRSTPTPHSRSRSEKRPLRPLARLGMMLVVAALLPSHLASCPHAAADDAPPPSPAAIDAAIERGVAWILEAQKPPGHFGDVGKTALAAFALHHAGVREGRATAAGKQMSRALRYLDRSGPGRGTRPEPRAQTYDIAVYLMLLRVRGRVQDHPRMQRLADLLCVRQARNGQWWYDGKGEPRIDTGDNSNTQFAMLALGHAQAAGLQVPTETWRRARRWWVRSPGTDGGFGYASAGSPKSASTGSMTAAGIACLALAEAALPAPAAPAGPSQAPTRAGEVRTKAIAFLAKHFSVSRNHGPTSDRRKQRQRKSGRGWLHYYLWSIERALVLAEQPKIAGRDWYAEGARRLLTTQAKDGSWRQEAPLFATAFALLFLTRAADPPRAFTPRARHPAPDDPQRPVTPPTGGPPEEAPPGGTRVPADPVPAGNVATWLPQNLPVGELARRCRHVGVSSLPPLVAALDAPDKEIRRRAWEALNALLPDARLRGADRHPLARGRLALWLRLQGRFLVLRGERFVEP